MVCGTKRVQKIQTNEEFVSSRILLIIYLNMYSLNNMILLPMTFINEGVSHWLSSFLSFLGISIGSPEKRTWFSERGLLQASLLSSITIFAPMSVRFPNYKGTLQHNCYIIYQSPRRNEFLKWTKIALNLFKLFPNIFISKIQIFFHFE